ncbi:hypothetical protein LZ31DRAFT_179775 [Colletotrichum somersetense]|nr:hypothetical protein LZ31DRAFT_179775 [Colletotrichum somersetense]
MQPRRGPPLLVWALLLPSNRPLQASMQGLAEQTMPNPRKTRVVLFCFIAFARVVCPVGSPVVAMTCVRRTINVRRPHTPSSQPQSPVRTSSLYVVSFLSILLTQASRGTDNLRESLDQTPPSRRPVSLPGTLVSGGQIAMLEPGRILTCDRRGTSNSVSRIRSWLWRVGIDSRRG